MYKNLKVQMHHFEDAIKKIRPLSKQELDMYKRISEQFGKPDVVFKGNLASKDSLVELGSGIT